MISKKFDCCYIKKDKGNWIPTVYFNIHTEIILLLYPPWSPRGPLSPFGPGAPFSPEGPCCPVDPGGPLGPTIEIRVPDSLQFFNGANYFKSYFLAINDK